MSEIPSNQWKRGGGRDSDFRPGPDALDRQTYDPVEEADVPDPRLVHYDHTDGPPTSPVTVNDDAWSANWKSKDNTEPPDYDEVTPGKGGLADLIAWVTSLPLGDPLRNRAMEILVAKSGRPTKEFYCDVKVEGRVEATEGITGPTDISGTNSDAFTIDQDNISGPDVDKTLLFKRGSVGSDAWLKWLATQQRFKMNFPLDVTELLINGSPLAPSGNRVDYARFEAWETYEEIDVHYPKTRYLDNQRGIVYDIPVEGPSSACKLVTQHRIGPDFDSLIGTNDFEVYMLRSAGSGIGCSITVTNQAGAVMGTLSSQPIEESDWSLAKKAVNCTSNPPAVGELVTAVIVFDGFAGVPPAGAWIRVTIPTFKYNRFGA